MSSPIAQLFGSLLAAGFQSFVLLYNQVQRGYEAEGGIDLQEDWIVAVKRQVYTWIFLLATEGPQTRDYNHTCKATTYKIHLCI